MSSVQYIIDHLGNRTAALVPIEEWERLLSFYQQHDEVKASLQRSATEVKRIKAGELEPLDIEELLDEL